MRKRVEREREIIEHREGFNVFCTMYNSRNETIDCSKDVVCGT